jgi:hypothetical protein
MAGELPFFVTGKIVEVSLAYEIAYAKVPNGNVYHLFPSTRGIDFYTLQKDQQIRLEVTTILTRVLSASIINTSAE